MITDDLKHMAKRLGCHWIGAVEVFPEAAYDYNNCHNNVLLHSKLYGGHRQTGYYFVSGFGTIQAIRHSVWRTKHALVDVTPYKDNRDYIIFGATVDNSYYIRNCYHQSLEQYLIQDFQVLYHVCQLIDPTTNQVLHVSKGKKTIHQLNNNAQLRNRYIESKITNIRCNSGYPFIEYVAENIIDEQLAHTIEAALIKKIVNEATQ